jgi:hypothetical protein
MTKEWNEIAQQRWQPGSNEMAKHAQEMMAFVY